MFCHMRIGVSKKDSGHETQSRGTKYNSLVLLIDVRNPPGIVHIKTHPLHFIFKPWRYMFP